MTCTFHRTAAFEAVEETGGNRSDTETGRGGSAATAEARTDGRVGEEATGEGAGAGRGGAHASMQRTDGHPDLSAVTGGTVGAETDREAKAETETGAEIERVGTGVRSAAGDSEMKMLIEKLKTNRGAKAERGKGC